MPAKVILKVTKGQHSGKIFSFGQKESLVVGRQGDCNIVLPEEAVSRRHCLLTVDLPSVTVRDLGSLNGTYLNEEITGRRDTGMSAEEARKQPSAEFPMKAGDRLRLGHDCEITLNVVFPQYCAECFCEIEPPAYTDKDGLSVCPDCRKARKQKEEALTVLEIKPDDRRREEALTVPTIKPDDRRREEAPTVPTIKPDDHRCEICGGPLTGELNACSACLKDPVRILDFILQQAADKGKDDAKEIIAGYRKIKELGRGGMGVVWLVEEKKTGEQMALKLMLPEAAADKQSRRLFLREAHIAGQLKHTNVVRQFNCGLSGDACFILMELCRGGSVFDLMKKNGGIVSLDLATHIILQALDGLHYIHHAQVAFTLNGTTATADGVVHRNFKPDNIFLSDNSSRPVAKVADFGLARAFEWSEKYDATTGQVEIAGTLPFMPRQQILDFRYAKPDVDVWAAAASYYNMLAGTYPKDFRGKDPYLAALTDPAVPIRRRNANIPEKLAAVIDTALIDRPNIGVRSALELKTAIENAL
ncbi:MAG: protein kinase [Tannerellaceae bacterium]|jgi:serine/threonine-protein kinase|nr:protein kinase [Tannerellaceae bacterium]